MNVDGIGFMQVNLFSLIKCQKIREACEVKGTFLERCVDCSGNQRTNY